MFVLVISRPSLHMGHVGLKTKSLDQICQYSGSRIFNWSMLKLSESGCFVLKSRCYKIKNENHREYYAAIEVYVTVLTMSCWKN